MSGPEPLADEDSEVLAAEYALGLLDDADQVRAERRMSGDPGFARMVEAWRLRLAGLTAEIAPEKPGPHVWAALARKLASGDVVELRLRRSLAIWRGAAAAAGAIAAALALAAVWPRPAPPSVPMLTARLAATARGPTVFVALYDPIRKAIVLTPASVTPAQDHSPELWLIPAGGKPIALGVGAFGSSVQLIPTASLSGVGSGTLAISVEPKGGSPTGQPTGPVIAKGQLSNL